jgi:tetratricopeptide (TPR) repeat protein
MPVSATCLVVEELHRLLPGLDELERLRLSIVGAAVPDPARAWDGSQAYTTLDKRVISLERLEDAAAEAEAELHEHVQMLFAGLRPVLRAYAAGEGDEAARALIALGEAQESRGRYRGARRCYEAALQLALPLVEKGPQLVVLRRLARIARVMGDLDEAQRYYRRSGELARDAGDSRAEVIARTGLGNVLAVQGHWVEAEAEYREALERAECLGEYEMRLELAQLCNNLAMITTRQNRLDEAERWVMAALARWAELDSPSDKAICYLNQGQLRARQGRAEEARAIYRRALSLPIPPEVRVNLCLDLAESYLRDGHLTQAHEYGREAEAQAIRAQSPYTLAGMYRGLGNIARGSGEDDGFIFFEKALQIAREKGYALLEAETLADYAELRAQSGQIEEARAYLERARELFVYIGAAHEQARAAERLHTLSVPTPLPVLD